jgi:hypothetical protein
VQKRDWLCPDCRKADDSTRLDARPRSREHPRLGTAQPQTANTEVTLPSTPPAVMEQLRRKRGRPKEVVIVEDASGAEIPTMDYEASERSPQPEKQPTRDGRALRQTAVSQPPRRASPVVGWGASVGAEQQQ